MFRQPSCLCYIDLLLQRNVYSHWILFIYKYCVLRFVTGYKGLTHHCTLYTKSDCPSLNVHRNTHWLHLKLLDGSYFFIFISQKTKGFVFLWYFTTVCPSCPHEVGKKSIWFRLLLLVLYHVMLLCLLWHVQLPSWPGLPCKRDLNLWVNYLVK